MSFRPIAALLLAALALPAAAHTPYLAPASFEVRPDSRVTLDASFAETFFVPEVVFDNSEFVVTAALKPYGTGLELVPVTHPSDLYRGERFDFTVQYDGQPLPAQTVEIHRALGDGARQPAPLTLTTDTAGKASFALDQAGTYLALIRYRGPAPAGAAAPMYGNNYTLSFRVLEP